MTTIRYKVSRKTVYKWRKRYDGTLESLKDRSHAPHRIARKQLAAYQSRSNDHIMTCLGSNEVLDLYLCVM